MDLRQKVSAESKRAAQASDAAQQLQRDLAALKEQKMEADAELDSLSKQCKDLEVRRATRWGFCMAALTAGPLARLRSMGCD